MVSRQHFCPAVLSQVNRLLQPGLHQQLLQGGPEAGLGVQQTLQYVSQPWRRKATNVYITHPSIY